MNFVMISITRCECETK